MSAKELFAEDFSQRKHALWNEFFEVSDALSNAKEGTHEYEILTLKKQALRTEEMLLEKLERMQYHYNFVREHAEQLVRFFNGN